VTRQIRVITLVGLGLAVDVRTGPRAPGQAVVDRRELLARLPRRAIRHLCDLAAAVGAGGRTITAVRTSIAAEVAKRLGTSRTRVGGE
jgi:hypothetical protein